MGQAVGNGLSVLQVEMYLQQLRVAIAQSRVPPILKGRAVSGVAPHSNVHKAGCAPCKWDLPFVNGV